jgi:hypothetical protein
MNTTELYKLPGEKAIDPAGVAVTGLFRTAIGGFGMFY